MPKSKSKPAQSPEEEHTKVLHPCWNCKNEMHILEQGIAQVRFVCPNCGEETHAWFYASQAEAERRDRFNGVSLWGETKEESR